MNFYLLKGRLDPQLRAGKLILLAGNGVAIAALPVDTISVTATRIERATKEVPSVIDSEQIEGARMMNIKDAIQGTPGVLIDSKKWRLRRAPDHSRCRAESQLRRTRDHGSKRRCADDRS